MPKIAIITDTDASLSAELAQQYNIRQVPITIHFGEESYTTGMDINDKQLFEIIDRKNKLPTTAAPPPAAFAKAYEEAFNEGADEIICICISSAMSATYTAAVNACEFFEGKKIHVIDSLTLSMAQGFMAIAASQAAQEGASSEEIIALIDSMRERLHIYGALTTLKYLAMSGRVGKLAAGMASTLDIKPILRSQNGKLEMLEKIRTDKKALNRVRDLCVEAVNSKPIEKAAIIHVNNLEGAARMQELLQAAIPDLKDVLIAEFTAGLAVHTGSGLVGVVLMTAE